MKIGLLKLVDDGFDVFDEAPCRAIVLRRRCFGDNKHHR